MIVGIAGPAGAGKDTVADLLVERGFVKLAFAGPLKEMLAVAGFPEPADRELKEKQYENFSFSWRQAAQMLGTEWGRALDPNIWTKIVGHRIDALSEQRKHVVISDVRFENEAALIRQYGHMIHVRGRQADLGNAATHISESGVAFVHGEDWLLSNSSTIERLHSSTNDLLECLHNRKAHDA